MDFVAGCVLSAGMMEKARTQGVPSAEAMEKENDDMANVMDLIAGCVPSAGVMEKARHRLSVTSTASACDSTNVMDFVAGCVPSAGMMEKARTQGVPSSEVMEKENVDTAVMDLVAGCVPSADVTEKARRRLSVASTASASDCTNMFDFIAGCVPSAKVIEKAVTHEKAARGTPLSPGARLLRAAGAARR